MSLSVEYLRFDIDTRRSIPLVLQAPKQRQQVLHPFPKSTSKECYLELENPVILLLMQVLLPNQQPDIGFPPHPRSTYGCEDSA